MALADRTQIMGIVNVTPDSFSDGGKFFNPERAVRHAWKLRNEGADIIDIGGESSRPGARKVSAKEEFLRIRPVVQKLVKRLDCPISIDTYKSEVAERCLDIGVSIINDITALRGDKKMKHVIAKYHAAVVLMHMQGKPRTMQLNPQYDNLISEIIKELKQGIRLAKEAGIGNDRIVIDPGIGFGKTVEHNLLVLKNLADFNALGYPVMIGTSRKSFIGKILNRDEHNRLFGSISTAVIAAAGGAHILRVHDAAKTRDALIMYDAVAGRGIRENREEVVSNRIW
ncbi:MAG: dihydropteroate synthase [Candidatus Omnitrophota bacterium]